MATLYISEYTHFAIDGANQTSTLGGPAVAEQAVPFTSSTTASATFSPRTNLVRLNADATCSVNFSTNSASVAATTQMHRLPANAIEYYSVVPSSVLSVITNT